MTKSQPERSGRRRSRQCRGKRARNYYRTLGRASNSEAQVRQVLADASYSGALASFNRQRGESK